MNSRNIGNILSTIGIMIAAFAGSKIARSAGFGNEGWLMGVFALGIILATQGPLFRLRQQIYEIQKKLDGDSNS